MKEAREGEVFDAAFVSIGIEFTIRSSVRTGDRINVTASKIIRFC